VRFIEELKAARDLDLLVSLSLIDGLPAVFEGDPRRFSEWKRDLAAGLAVDPHGLLLVGSAALGVSLNPNKAFKAFDARSDIDVAVVSPPHFEEAWWYLRTLGPALLTLTPPAKTAVKAHRERYVFSGTIATEHILPMLPFGRQWLAAASAASAQSPIDGRPVHFRLYRDPAALRLYQREGFIAARNQLLKSS
jgi:hypothetical protein